ncbi:MAG: phospholipase D family protein [Cyanobacterium sp.]
MELYWKIKGKYQKIPKKKDSVKRTSLKTIINDIQAIATQQNISNLSTFNQSFGLNFLPPNIANYLLKNNLDKSTIIIDDKIKFSRKSKDTFQPIQYDYQFIPEESQEISVLRLASNDEQIPVNLIDICEGFYQLKLSEHETNSIINHKKQNALNEVNLFFLQQPLTIISNFLTNSNLNSYFIPLFNDCIAFLRIKDLPINLQEGIQILKDNPFSSSDNLLVTAYQQKYLTLSPTNFIFSSLDNNNITGNNQVIIKKGKHRELLYKLIDEAEKFLLISSYRLEDENIIDRIVKKSSQLPFGIWIVTDFNDKVQDLVDSNMEEEREDILEYSSSNEKKQSCLHLLAKAGIGFRSGNFHLKTYISEKMAYFGSCNLTGGSLSRNIEAGILFSHSSEYQFLVKYFSYLWDNKSEAQFFPTIRGFEIQNLIPKNDTISLDKYFLNPSQYEEDLTRSLQQFKQNPQGKIVIYTRNFQPNGIQTNLFKKLPCNIYYCNFNCSDLPAKKIPYLHSKVTIVGNQVAYISSQDFVFGHYNLHDLTYKITKREKIEKIKQQLKEL